MAISGKQRGTATPVWFSLKKLQPAPNWSIYKLKVQQSWRELPVNQYSSCGAFLAAVPWLCCSLSALSLCLSLSRSPSPCDCRFRGWERGSDLHSTVPSPRLSFVFQGIMNNLQLLSLPVKTWQPSIQLTNLTSPGDNQCTATQRTRIEAWIQEPEAHYWKKRERERK